MAHQPEGVLEDHPPRQQHQGLADEDREPDEEDEQLGDAYEMRRQGKGVIGGERAAG